MLDHHIQRTILNRLAFSPGLRFSELKPDTIENKLFDYHLKKVILSKLVVKDTEGSYTLTPEGRRLGRRTLESNLALADKAESVLFLAIRRKTDRAWLLYRRKAHPFLSKVGFMHAYPVAGSRVEDTASAYCLQKTSLTASFRVLGNGLFETYIDDELESFTNFTFLISDDAEGELMQNDEFAEYYWDNNPDFSEDNMLPNMKLLGEKHKINQLFYVQKKFDISSI